MDARNILTQRKHPAFAVVPFDAICSIQLIEVALSHSVARVTCLTGWVEQMILTADTSATYSRSEFVIHPFVLVQVTTCFEMFGWNTALHRMVHVGVCHGYHTP